MRSQLLLILGFCVMVASSCSEAYGQTTVTAKGTRSTAFVIQNGNVIYQGPSNATIDRLAKQVNAVSRKSALLDKDLRQLIDFLNRTILPIVLSAAQNSSETNARLKALEDRLTIATDYPSTARDVLRPYLDPAIDLTNSRYEVNEFLDANGKSEFRLVFRLQGNCQVFVRNSGGMSNFSAARILSDAGSRIWQASFALGEHSPVSLSTGTYQFVVVTGRRASQHFATLSARCS